MSKKYRFESIQKNEVVTIHQSFNINSENTRQALMYGIVNMIQDKTATSIVTKCKPLSEVTHKMDSHLFNYRNKVNAVGWEGMPRER